MTAFPSMVCIPHRIVGCQQCRGIHTTREQRRQMARDNAKQPLTLREVPREQWPSDSDPTRLRVLRSHDFLVQVFVAPEPVLLRLSVNRSTLSGDRWTDGISWDDLQRLKNEAGYGMYDAVEVFPHEWDVVDVANMRHLWVMRESLSFAWRRKA